MTDPEPFQPGALESFFRRFATTIVNHPARILLGWALLVGLTTPWALQLPDMLTRQGASKIVPGSPSAVVAKALVRSFPQHSERETVIVLTARADAASAVPRLQASIDSSLERLRGNRTVLQTISAYTLHREAVLAALQQAAAQLPAGSTRERVAAIDVAQHGHAVPSGLAPLLRQAVTTPEAGWPQLAAAFAAATDWTQFPVPVDDAGLVSPDGLTSLITVGYAPHGPDPDLASLRHSVRDILTAAGQQDAVSAWVTGELALVQDTYDQAEADNALMEYVAYGVIALVLLLFFRAVLPVVLTVAMIALTMNISQAWLYLLSRSLNLTQFTVTIMTFVMLGAGIDYSMLLSSRYRQERVAGHPVREAVIRATTHAGETIALAGSAVVIAFGATLVAPVDWIPPLGYGGLIGLPVVLLAALTVTPCLLMLLGDRFFLLGWNPLSDLESSGGLARRLRRIAGFTVRSPRKVVVAFLLATIPFVGLIVSHGLTSDPVALSPDTQARRGYQQVSRQWGEGALLPSVVLARLDSTQASHGTLTPQGFAAVSAVTSTIAAVGGVQEVRSITRPGSRPLTLAEVPSLPANIRQDYLAADGTLRISLTLRGEPLSPQSRRTIAAVTTALRGSALPHAQVGGATLVDQEYDAALMSSFWKMIALVSLGVIVLLLVTMRSVFIPVRLVLTIMLSNVWAVGTTFLVFAVWREEAVINDLPVFLVILMMGLGMDYEIFLMTRVRDLVRRNRSDEEAVTQAIVDTGRVITAAGLVMSGSLGAMSLSSTLMLQQYGVGLGTAVLLDATLVRMLLVPASFLLLGTCNWWIPRWLGRPALRTA
jgi:RND superfamily putative drug exporter